MSEWTERLLAQYTVKEIQQQAASLGIKNVKKFTKADLADQIEAILDKKDAAEDHLHTNDADNDTDKIEEITMNTNETPTTDDAAVAELEALLTSTATDEAEIEAEATKIANQIMGVEPFTADELTGIAEVVEVTAIVGEPEEIVNLLEDSLADVPGENDTEAATKITPEYHAMLDEVRANAAKRKHPMWTEIIAKAEDGPLAQIAGKANTVRGILWKIGKHLAPLIAAYDGAEAEKASATAEFEAEKNEVLNEE